MLVTTGGDPDCAYRIARCLQAKYEEFILYVSGCCKSAGTLVAIGAHCLVVSDHGELGPLDVQMSKKDELWETQSGLTVMDTLTALQHKALFTFEKIFLSIKAKSGGAITLKTATEIATEMTTGLFTSLYGQVDPMHVGEAGRAMSIANYYGKRLLTESRNIDPDALEFIISQYPSHGFVIDRQEAGRLFQNVREPTSDETLLAEKLGELARWPNDNNLDAQGQYFKFLSTELTAAEGELEDQTGGDNDSESRRPSRIGPSEVTGKAREKFSEIDSEGGAVTDIDSDRENQGKSKGSA